VLLDEDEEVGYGFDELDELTHAYAVSIHRSQGSEYPCVVVPLTTSAWLMLQRNLLYTAVTRAKRIVILVGSKRALAKAVRTQGAGRRYTTLTERLRPGRAGLSQQPIGRSAGQLQQASVEPAQRVLRSGQTAGRSR
jgi:exodeoxyribonuclease V alpha subunit